MQILFVWKHHVDADVGVRFVGLNHILWKIKKGTGLRPSLGC